MVYINSLGSSPGLRLGYRFRYRPLDTLLSRVFTHCLCFSFQEFVFSLCHFSVSFSEIASEFTVGAYDPMAGDFGGEGVFLQGLANGLRTSAAYAFYRIEKIVAREAELRTAVDENIKDLEI